MEGDNNANKNASPAVVQDGGRDLKPVLMSALLFPGAGQYVLGRRLLALVFALPALAAAGYFLWTALEPAFLIADEINRGALAFDIPQIVARVRRHHASIAHIELAVWVIVLAWAGSVAEAWLRPQRRRS